ncbi:hypothetical protein EVAR_65287_1 [Eumeta japonica]|uniref:Uncharacterized protein n=1 Tax=Eumeta variegata TaxID=151549 RepID=A0A4C1ZQE0_EUMVA|nr:hypothetical protein EVAR_65287_1 [Eumeta japonica]
MNQLWISSRVWLESRPLLITQVPCQRPQCFPTTAPHEPSLRICGKHENHKKIQYLKARAPAGGKTAVSDPYLRVHSHGGVLPTFFHFKKLMSSAGPSFDQGEHPQLRGPRATAPLALPRRCRCRFKYEDAPILRQGGTAIGIEMVLSATFRINSVVESDTDDTDTGSILS